MSDWAPGHALAAYHAGVTVICELAAQFTGEAWEAATPCPEWRAADLAAHLRCVADDYHEYLDDAPFSRLSRLIAASSGPESLARKLARQNAAELAALADATGPEHIAAFAASARAYADRALAVWDMPHHRYRDAVVTAGGMLGAACAEWHLHAWDLAQALGKDYRPADPGLLVEGWQAGLPQVDLGLPLAMAACGAGTGRMRHRSLASVPRAMARAPVVTGAAPDGGAWCTLLRASGRLAAEAS